jgi:DNA-binding NarL/FixJ family response regulator
MTEPPGGSSKSKAGQAPRVKKKPDKIGVMIVDDHPIMRNGLARVIDHTPDLYVCCEAGNAVQALDLLKVCQPGLILVDIALGGQNGLELIKDLRVQRPELRIVVHSMYEENIYAERCLRAGARGYVMKQEPSARLLRALRQVVRGEISLSEAMTKQLLARLSGGKSHQGQAPDELLSDRELEVFESLGQGHSTKEIAQLLHLSEKTVQTHREHIKRKLNIADAVALVRRAVQWIESRA